MVALYNYMAQMIIELVKLGSMVITLNKSAACANRIQSILEVKRSMTCPSADGPLQPVGQGPAVAFHQVSFGYAGGADAVSELDFTIPKGATVGIIGGTGSGKTTLVNLIPRFYDVIRGRVEVDGRDVRDYPAGTLLDKNRLVPQKAVLFEGTIRDNLRWGKADATMKNCGRPWKPPRPKTWCWARRGSWMLWWNRGDGTCPEARNSG